MPTIDNAGTHVFFTDQGEGPPLVLGHSFLCSGEMWAPQIPALAGRNRVVNVDFRGHGRSGPVRGPVTLDDLVGDMVAVLDHLGLERAAWGGLSIGGMVALRAALTVPDRVAALLLLDTHAGSESALKKIKYRLMAGGVRLLGIRPLLPLVVPLMFGRTTSRTRADLVREWRERFAALDAESMLHLLGTLNDREGVEHRLAEIRVPALVLVGQEDRSLPPALSERLARGLPQASYEVIPEAGHLSCLEQPESVTAAMLGFLDRLREIDPQFGADRPQPPEG